MTDHRFRTRAVHRRRRTSALLLAGCGMTAFLLAACGDAAVSHPEAGRFTIPGTSAPPGVTTPATPGPAFAIGEKTSDPVSMYLNDVFTVTVNLAGLPGISVPAGLTPDGLPLGLQIIGRAFDEATVLRVGRSVEQAAAFGAKPEAWWRAA